MYRIAASIEQPNNVYPLRNNRFINTLASTDKIKSLLLQYKSGGFQLEDCVREISSEVKSSAVFKRYLKELNGSRIDDVKLWRDIFHLLILNNAEFGRLVEGYENYSMRGFERMRELIDNTFRNFSTSQDNVSDAVKTLDESLMCSYNLYLLMLLLPVRLTEMQNERLEMGRLKFLPEEEDINPNLNFVGNKVVKAMASDSELLKKAEERKLNWLPQGNIMLSHLLKRITESTDYKEYMKLNNPTVNDDCELWKNLFKHVIFRDSDFVETLEEMSVFWNDDIDIIGTFVLKTLKRYCEKIEIKNTDVSAADIDQAGLDKPLLPMYKDAEDERFAEELFRAVVRCKDDYVGYIDRFVVEDHWDIDRLAIMDVVIVITAMAEMLNFPKIPIRVSVNEYIEMAKAYSTPKSGSFVNGILASIIGQLKVERKLLKE